WSFTNSNVGNVCTSGFTLGYTIAVTPGTPLNPLIMGSKHQIDSGFTPVNNLTAMNDTHNIPGGALQTDGTTTPNETIQVIYARPALSLSDRIFLPQAAFLIPIAHPP